MSHPHPVSKKIIIGLCTYNNEFGLSNGVLDNLAFLFESKCFLKMHVVFFYDQSQDRSIYILKSFQNKYPENVFIIENAINPGNLKTEKIAFARNGILDFIRKSPEKYDFFAMMDSNEYSCVGKIDIDHLLEVFYLTTEWDAVSFVREAGYYDHWALSYDPFIYSFFHFTNWQKVVAMMREDFNGRYLPSFREGDFMPVYSAFNGFAIYKIEKFIDCNYSSIINNSLFPENSIQNEIDIVREKIVGVKNDCEHRHFHLESIRKYDSNICIYNKSVFKKVKYPLAKLRGPC